MKLNLPNIHGLRTAPHRYGSTCMGIHLSRFGASWINSGGNQHDRDGFIIWMMNLPFNNEDGSIVYPSQDDAEDAYWIMSCGKLELETAAKKFIEMHEIDKRGYTIIKETE